MKSLRTLFSAFLLLTAFTWTANSAQAAIFNLDAILDGLQETPPNASPATGFGTFIYDDVTNNLSYNITFLGLVAPENNAHIHTAFPGVPGPVTFPLPLGNPKVGLIPGISAAQETDLLAGKMYVNIHSQAFPGGEIRGQITVVPEPSTFILGGFAVAGLVFWRVRRRSSP